MGILGRIEKFLDGKKTYLVAGVMAVAGFLLGIGKITQDQYNHLIMVIIPAALAALRSAIGNK